MDDEANKLVRVNILSRLLAEALEGLDDGRLASTEFVSELREIEERAIVQLDATRSHS